MKPTLYVVMFVGIVAWYVCSPSSRTSLAEQPPSGGATETGTKTGSTTRDLEHAKNLDQQVRTLYEQGRYAEAVSLAKETLAIREKALGAEHPAVATSLNNLGELYRALGEYAKAELLHQRALAIREKALGPEHSEVATSLNNLAELYRTLGEYAKAEPRYQRALAIQEKVLGPEHPAVALSLSNLAGLYTSLGAYAKAEPRYQRALAISEKVLGPEHLAVALSLNNLAALYDTLGEYANAEPLHQRALAIREKVLGPEHLDVANSLNNLAALYDDLGKYAKAEPLYQRALTISKKALGPEHPTVALSLNNLAGVYATLGRFEDAHTLCYQAQQIDATLIEQVMGFTSEDQKLRFLTTKTGDLNLFLSLVSQHLVHQPAARRDALDVWLRRKGVILEAQKRFQEAVVSADDPETVTTFQELSRVRAQLSRLAFVGPGKAGPEAYKTSKETLEAQKEYLEATLSRLSQAYAVNQKIANADPEHVAKALPPHTVLLECARVRMFNFTATGTEHRWHPAHYLVFVLHAGDGEPVGLIDLGEAEMIDEAVAAFKAQVLRGGRDPSSLQALRTASERVYTLVVAPLLEELGAVKEIFISPDGNLNLIPFEVLIGPDGRFLIEEYTFTYLAAGRDVLGFGERQEQQNPSLIIGDPDFDLTILPTPDPLRQAQDRLSQEGKDTPLPASRGDGGRLTRSAEMRGFAFDRLPGTRAEVETIHTLLGSDQAVLYTDKEALEEMLMHHEAPRILHLATHGFFLEDQDLPDVGGDEVSRGLVLGSSPLPMTSPPASPAPSGSKRFENPLLRSGIVLAGANTAIGADGHARGIVTAEKILGLNLRGTEMVVLSACETGLGDVQAGEGVFGLRRAITQAGAASLVMSLWSVPDQETQELMVQFYRNLLTGSMSRSQALRQAALSQMRIVEERYGFPHPLYWGAFVFMGEP